MRKIVIIEDDTALLASYKQAFDGEGFEILEASSVDEGLKCIMSSLPSLILLDIMLPGGKNGFDALEVLKRNPQTAHIPVIVLTNLDTEEETARSIGASDYLVKSNVSILEIIKKVKQFALPTQ
ncbi:MAG: response regulator [bacterium]|nr:response regulator [bacterium]